LIAGFVGNPVTPKKYGKKNQREKEKVAEQRKEMQVSAPSWGFVLPRSWDYHYRFVEPFFLTFRGKKIKINQSAIGSRVGATVWDCVWPVFFFFVSVSFPFLSFWCTRSAVLLTFLLWIGNKVYCDV
jgi:hypothetical protein